MDAKRGNRFALFAEDDESLSPSPEAPNKFSPFANQVAEDNANSWHEVKRGAQRTKSKAKTLIIRDENKVPSAHHGPKQTRTFSGSTQTSTDKPEDPHENWCGVCHIKFPCKNALLTHIKQVPKHENYCNLCKRVFKDRNGLKNHVDYSLGHDIFCNLCLSAFKDSWGLKNHFENNYHVGHEFVCLTCLLGFRSKIELDKHLQTGEKHVWCHTCHRKFRNQDERDAHWINTMKHKHCLQPGCDFDAPNMVVLEQHLEEDHFRCEGCKRIFPSQTKLAQHHEHCKFGIRCPNCGEPCPGQVGLAAHLDACFSCPECGYHTNHEGNYHIHMTKHATATLTCWGCATPMRTHSSLINHLESSRCPRLPDPSLFTLCLGRSWYSPLYMDLDLHAQIRSGWVNLREVTSWMNQGLLSPFMCRARGCDKAFGHFSSLVLHVESQACEWDVERLRLDLLRQEFVDTCLRRDSMVE